MRLPRILILSVMGIVLLPNHFDAGGAVTNPHLGQSPAMPLTHVSYRDEPWPTDYASMQNTAGIHATSEHPDFKLHEIILIVEFRGAVPKILEGKFLYVRPDARAAGKREHIAVGMRQQRRQQQIQALHISNIGVGHQLPELVPDGFRGPEDIFNRLEQMRPKVRRRDQTMRVRLDYAGTVRPNYFGHAPPAETLRDPDPGPEEFIRTVVPPNRWIWWTEVEVAKPGPNNPRTKLRRREIYGQNPRGDQNIPDAGEDTQEWSEFLILDAVTGALTSKCAEFVPPPPRERPTGPPPGQASFAPIECK